jgi:regulator of sirC expression with transglutaminase-like and TPR domain
MRNIGPETDFDTLDLAMLALMISEDIQDDSILMPGLQALTTLRQAILPLVTAESEVERIEQLRHAFFVELGFHGDWQQFFLPENCLLDQVLARRTGVPISLGILLLHLAHALAIPAQGICFPGHFMVRIGTGKQARILDPFGGEFLDRQQLELRLRGSLGDLARLQDQHLRAASQREILERLLSVGKGSSLQADQLLMALRCSQLLLCLNPDDPYEVRDRGLLYEQLECEPWAAEDFSFFIEQCPADPVADVLKEQLAQLDSSAPTLH